MKVFELFESCIEASEFLLTRNISNINQALFIVEDFKKSMEYVKNNLISNDRTKFTRELIYCENVLFILEEIKDIKILNDVIFKIKYELYPCMAELKDFFSMRKINYNIADEIVLYRKNREEIFKDRINNKETEYKYQVSIVVIAYNKLEYTQKAIESIYKYTDFSKLNVELITLNNGSTDGTREYFDSLPHCKKINLKNNILGTSVGDYAVEGKYIVAFSNDVIATENWLENLLECIKSSNDIFWVVPTCNEDGISNNQGIKVSYNNSFESIGEIELFAQEHNISNPLLWEERSMLMPFVWIGKSNLIKGFSDKLYTQWEFIDDDWSTLIRRLGLKQILAKDTFMHHFGSVTLRDERKNGSLENMRELYYKKWGVDAWDSRGEVEGFEHLLKYDIYDNPKILFIEPKFGTNTLNIKKILRDKGIKALKMVAAIFDKRYLPDARYMYDQIIEVNSTEELIEYKEKYSLISFGTYINEIEKEDIIKFLESLYHKLENKGQIIFTIKNFRNAKIIFNLLTNNPLEVCGYEKIDFHGCDFDRLFERLSQNELLSSFEVHAIYNHDKEVDTILSLDDSINKMPVSAIERLRNEIGTKYYTFVINKNG